VERVRHKVEQIHKRDQAVKAFGKTIKKGEKAKKSATSSLELFSLIA